jgi:hypothetical protein
VRRTGRLRLSSSQHPPWLLLSQAVMALTPAAALGLLLPLLLLVHPK